MSDGVTDAMGAGSAEWLSYHIFYHGEHDLLLSQLVLDSLRSLCSRQWVQRFFFIRYGLGGPHVRLRLLCDPADRGAVDRLLRDRAGTFFAHSPSTASRDEEAIRTGNEQILKSDPTGIDAVYPDNSVLELPFHPELERYGGPGLIEHSLRFFFLSSIYALDFIERHAQEKKTRKTALILRALLRQALGFAGGEEELIHLLSQTFQKEGAPEVPWIAGADREFERCSEAYTGLIEEEIENLLDWEGECPLELSLAEGSRLLSLLTREAAGSTRCRIVTSHFHMTANRLGLLPWEEVFLGRILWQAVRKAAASRPAIFRRLSDTMAARQPRDQGGLDTLVAACCEELVNGQESS